MTDYHKRVKVGYVDAPDATEGEKRLLEFIRTDPYEEDYSPELLEFLDEAFRSILFHGEDPKKALKLEAKQGVKSGYAKARQINKVLQSAVMVEEKIEGGMLPDDARQAVADKLGVSYRTVIRGHTEDLARLAKEQIASWRKHDELTAAFKAAAKARAADPKKSARPKKIVEKIYLPYCEYCGCYLKLWISETVCQNCGHEQDKK